MINTGLELVVKVAHDWAKEAPVLTCGWFSVKIMWRNASLAEKHHYVDFALRYSSLCSSTSHLPGG